MSILALGLIALAYHPNETSFIPFGERWATFPDSAASPYPIEAIFQRFEHGMMVWRSDKNCVYALADSPGRVIIPLEIPWAGKNQGYGYCLMVDLPTERSIEASPSEDRFLPQGAIGRVWNYYSEVQTKLGYATAPEQPYTATIPTNEGQASMDGSPFYWRQMTLPDGTVLQCGSRGATAGTCDLSTQGT
jgi:hypothetical protein